MSTSKSPTTKDIITGQEVQVRGRVIERYNNGIVVGLLKNSGHEASFLIKDIHNISYTEEGDTIILTVSVMAVTKSNLYIKLTSDKGRRVFGSNIAPSIILPKQNN